MLKLSKASIIVGVIALVLFVFLPVWGGINYNVLVAARNAVDNKFSSVDVHEQKRMDKIGMLVNATTGSQIQEQEVFKAIADGRKQYLSATTTDDKVAASQVISNNLAALRPLQEQYPELKSNQNVQTLMGEMSGIENEIADVRKAYNNEVTTYNNKVESMPTMPFAALFHFEKRELFKANSAAKSAPNTDTTDKLRPQPTTTTNQVTQPQTAQ